MASANEAAAHIDLSYRQFRRLVKSGVLPPAKPHIGYDLDAVRAAYIRYLRGIKAGHVKVGENGQTETEEDGDFSSLLEKEKYREKKRENDLAEHLVAPVAVLSEALEKACSVIIPILESLPLVMKRKWPEITGDQTTLVKQAIAECRNEIADLEIEIEEDL